MPTTDPLTGSRLANRYRIIYRIGEGGMGVTYRAWDCKTGRPVVLKCPRKEMLVVAGFRDRFEREARTLANLMHPNIVPIDNLGVFDGLPYFAMPYLPGGSLANRRLRDADGRVKPMQPSTLHLWLPQVASALDHVHEAGVIHRDVKPGNIFFDSAWHAYLGDFGIAKSTTNVPGTDGEQPLTATNIAIGTPEYMAPEMFAPVATIDGRADQYALAVIVYEMLAGRRPFSGDSSHIVVEVMTHPVPPLSALRNDLPPSLQQAIGTALAKKAADRFRDCWTFARAALADVPPATDEPGVARLLCPNSNCNNNLKLPTSAAGQKGKCPRCACQMIIAPDLSALWLVQEESNEPATPADTRNATPGPGRTSLRRRSSRRSREQEVAESRRTLLVTGLVASLVGAAIGSQIGSARARQDLAKQNEVLEQAVKDLTTGKAALEQENGTLKTLLRNANP